MALLYTISLYFARLFFNKNSKLIINIQIVSVYLDYLIICEYLFDIRAANYIVIFFVNSFVFVTYGIMCEKV